MATFTGAARTANTFVGTAADDLFRFAAADINARDSVTGGGGIDRLQLTSAGLLADTALAGVKGVEQIALAGGANAIKLADANFIGVTGSKIAVSGASGKDRLDASSLTGANRIDVSSGGGLDVLRGGSGADVFRFAAANLGGDTVVGGGGSDLLLLTSGGGLGTGGMGLVSGIETIRLAGAGNIISLANANFVGVAGAKIVVTGGAGTDSVNASALTGASRVDITAGAGADVLRGGAGADVFRFTAANMAGDTVVGGAGSDLLVLTTGGKLGTGGITRVSGVETIALAAGGNPITLTNVNFAGVAGAKIAVTGGAGADTVDASGLTGVNAIDVTAGAGADVLRGGAGADVFRFLAANMAGDTVVGGLGSDRLVLTTGGKLGTGGLTRVSGVETIVLAAGGNPITLTNANFADVAGAKIVVTGGAGADSVNASALTGASRVDITAGAGADVLRGGAGADVFRFVAANMAGDTVVGGAGSDRLVLTTGGALGTGGLTRVSGVETIVLAAGGNPITLTNTNFAGIADAKIVVTGGAGDNTINAAGLTGVNRIDVTAGAGLDTLRGGAGADVFRFARAQLDGDTVQGGGGVDTLLLTTAGGLGGTALAHVTGVETIRLAAGGNALALVDANFAGVAGQIITVIGGAGPNLVDAGQLTGSNSIDVTAGKDIDSLTGGAGNDVFRFQAGDLAGDTVAGGSGFDRLVLTSAGAVGSLANMNGIDQIELAAGGNALVLTEAVLAVPLGGEGRPEIFGSAGDSTIDASAMTSNGVRFRDGGGTDAITGSEADDVFSYLDGTTVNVLDTIDGGAGTDIITVDRSTNFLDGSITSVELLYAGAIEDTLVQLSGANAAGLRFVGGLGINGYSNVFSVLLAAGSSTDLSNLGLTSGDKGDAITVVASSGRTSVTLSSSIASFTGSADDDTVQLASGAGYMAGAVINAGGGDDRVDGLGRGTFTLDGGTGTDTLVLREGVSVTLSRIENQVSAANGRVVKNFENVDASAAAAAVNVVGRDDVVSVLIGGSGADSLFAGALGAIMTGGEGADSLNGGDGADAFRVRSTAEVVGDTIDGGTGADGIDLFGSADLTGATITNVETLYLAAATAQGAFTNDAVTITVLASQLAQLSGGIFGNGYFTDSVETLVVKVDSASLDLSGLGFSYWGADDRVEINGTTGTDTIIGTSQNDVIRGSRDATGLFSPGAKDSLSGGGGDDKIFYSPRASQTSDGGDGTDTLALNTTYTLGSISSRVIALAVDLAAGKVTETVQASTQSVPPITYTTTTTQSAMNFENVDFGNSDVTTKLTGSGTDNTLTAGSGADTITGGLGSDTLTGGGGADNFVWNSQLEGGDTITDFERGADKLVFSTAQFGFSNASFDSAVTTLESIGDGSDLVVLSEAASIIDLIGNILQNLYDFNKNLYIICPDINGSQILYYCPNIRTGSIDEDAVFHSYVPELIRIADISAGSAPGLSDFVFV